MADEPTRSDLSDGGVVRIGLLGCGNVGRAFLELVDNERAAIARRSGIDLEIVKVAVHDLESVIPPINRPERLTTDAQSVVSDPSIDLIVELIGGIDPARVLIIAALAANKSVVTANKELIAIHGQELFGAAEKAHQDLLFEGSVAGAIPLLRALRVSLSGERIRRITGIVNGTTNYILSRMSEETIDYGAALAEAQRLGYAERDPTADVKGFDAAAKAAILAGIAFNVEVTSSDVHREGIDAITLADIEFARQLGYVVKLLAVVEQFSDSVGVATEIGVRVHPAMVPLDHPLAGVRGPYNAVFVEGEACGELMFYGRGAGGLPTSSVVLGDVLDAANHRQSARPTAPARHHVALRPIGELATQYYISIDVLDQPGVLGAVAAIFGNCGVSIRSMEQVGLSDEARLVFITHTAREADVQATLAALSDLESVRRIGGLLRVIGPEPTSADGRAS